MTKKLLSVLSAGALALCLTACGGDDDGDTTADATPSPESSSSAAPDDETPTPDDTSSEATPADGPEADYINLITVLFSQQPPDGGYASAKDFNDGSDFPDGITIGSFDRDSQEACIQDETNDIAFSISADDDVPAFVLLDGLCKGGTEVSRIVPDPKDPNEVQVKGDQDLGGAARDALQQRFGG